MKKDLSSIKPKQVFFSLVFTFLLFLTILPVRASAEENINNFDSETSGEQIHNENKEQIHNTDEDKKTEKGSGNQNNSTSKVDDAPAEDSDDSSPNNIETSNSYLSEGSEGSQVQEFKEDLMEAGFANSWTNPDDYFGEETVDYIKNFQEYYGLEVTGEADEATLNQLAAVLEAVSENVSTETEEETNQKEEVSESTQSSDNNSQITLMNATLANNDYLSEGGNGPEVRQFKTDLMAAGFASSWTNPNENFGPETVEYVEEFQAYYGLEVTGEGNKATLNQLSDVLNSPYQLGASSSDVREIKTDLMNLGFADQWTNPNNNYGPETVEVVKDFQSYYNLAVNGIIDEVTYSAIQDLTYNTSQDLTDTSLSYGSEGTHVTEFKKDIMQAGFATSWTNPNNNYGPETVEYVKEFQTYYGLETTGDGDEATLNQLNEVLNSDYQLGNSSSEIREVKTDLMNLGFADQWTNPNNNYGPETVEVVKDFQSYHGLVVNGIIDEVTYTAIQELVNSPLAPGSSGANVREFKADLMAAGFATSWTNPNNNYGPETVEVVRNFQSYYGLAVNGIIDSVTAEKIDSLLERSDQVGASGPEIQEIKLDLMNLGFADHWNYPNDNYGPGTVEVVRSFQSYYGLAVNGIIDSNTAAKIDSVLNSPYQLGASGSEVQEIKLDLMTLGFADHWNYPNDNYGPGTVEVVEDFQSAYNLAVSGIVDEVTLANIIQAIEDYNNRKITVYLDPGHGGTDTGAYYGGVAEREINLEVSKKVSNQLTDLGYEVIMSRNSQSNSYHSDSNDDIYARPEKANELDADIYVSVHHNAMPGNSSVSGIETYYYGPSSNYPPLPENTGSHTDPERLNKSLELATLIQDELIEASGANDRGVKRGAFVVVRETKMPAVLLELGYMSNPAELNRVTSDSYQNILADAVVRGINQYFGR